MTAITTVEFAYFDDAPFVDRNRFVDGRTETTAEIVDEHAELPEAFHAVLLYLLNHADSAQCARCADPVGFVLRETPAGGERLQWTPTGVAREVGRADAVALCELCTPFVPEAEGTVAK